MSTKHPSANDTPPPAPPPASAKKTSKRATKTGTRPIDELARASGRTMVLTTTLSRTLNPKLVYTADHAAAAALHGWDAHRHHFGEHLYLTARDYEAAIVAATTTPEGEREPVPHRAALSPRCPHRFDAALCERVWRARSAS
jgi:hypothetical protein